MNTAKTLYIIRGLPGSGKTTFAHQVANSVCSADDYFTDIEGNYNFDASKIASAHEDCKTRIKLYMRSNEPRVAVANTFTQEWEMKPYFALAEKYGYNVHTIILENRHGSKDIHNVPDDVIEKMEKRFSIKLNG